MRSENVSLSLIFIREIFSNMYIQNPTSNKLNKHSDTYSSL